MKVQHLGMAIVLAAASAMSSFPAHATTGLFATEPAAQQACQADEVVWVDLDRGRFYHKTQSNFGKSNNGGYTCMKSAHAQYRESHDE
jgi:hypothetical protein